jgi:hypothetical protein
VSWRLPRRREAETGQSMIEFALIVPVFMMLLLGMLEFGFVFSHHLTLEYATREGARTGAALGAGNPTTPLPCADVDGYVIAAVQRVLTSPGSQVPPGSVSQITIFKSDANGNVVGGSNVWVPGTSSAADGTPLQWVPSGGTGWSACSRNTASSNPDSLGVALTYRYTSVTPLGGLLGVAAGTQLLINDRTVMALNPTN